MKDREYMWQMIGFTLLCLIPVGMVVLYAVWKPFGILVGLIVLSLLVSPIAMIASKSGGHTGGAVKKTTVTKTKKVKKVVKPKISEHKRKMKEFERYAFWINVFDDDEF